MRRISGLVMCVLVWLCSGVFASAQGNANRDKDFTFLYLASPYASRFNSTAELRKPFEAALAQENQPAFLVVNGGLTANGRNSSWAQFQEAMEALPQGFPIYALPSGSDYTFDPFSKAEVFQLFYGGGKREAKGRPARDNKIEDRLYQSFDVEGVHIVLLDAALPLEPHNAYAHLDTEQLNWLDKDLKKLKRDTPILVFLNTSFGSEAISTRPLANEFELWQVLRTQNVAAIFAAKNTNVGEKNVIDKPLNGTHVVSLPTVGDGFVYKVRVTPLRVSIDEIRLDGTKPIAQISAFTLTYSTRKSVLKAAFDDDGNPFLVRRHPVGLLEPRAVSDNPEEESAEYRIDEGEYQPMKRDARDIWRSPFRTEAMPVGIHTATVRVTSESENRVPHSSEIIFEVERDAKEATRRWASNLDNPIVSNPILSGNLLYVSGTDAKLYALNILDGKKRTLLTARGGFYAAPCLADGTIYIGSTDKTFYAVNTENGSLRWKFETDAPIYATAAVAQGVVCFGGKGKVYGLDIRTGKPVWEQRLADFSQSAVTTEGDVFVVARVGGAFAALDVKTGKIRATPALSADTAPNVPAERAWTAAVSNGKVYCIQRNNSFAAYDVRTGNLFWLNRSLIGQSELDGATPAVFAATLFLIGNNSKTGRLYALDTTDGHLLWQVPLAQPVIKAGVKLAPDGKTLAVVGVRGSVSVHRTQDGKKLWGYELGPGNVFSTPEYDGQTVYTATMANDVQALNAPGYDPKKRAEVKK